MERVYGADFGGGAEYGYGGILLRCDCAALADGGGQWAGDHVWIWNRDSVRDDGVDGDAVDEDDDGRLWAAGESRSWLS